LDGGFEEREAWLLARRRVGADVCGAFQSSFSLVAGGRCDAEWGALHRAGLTIASVVAAVHGAEPAYHNRHHAAEATLAMGWLCRAALALGLLSARQAALGVVAMVGHDLDHDGSTVGGGLLEARSWAAVRPHASAAGLDEAALASLGDVILSTDPALVAVNAARARGAAPGGPLGAGQDMLRMLANEADVYASMLPRLGPCLSRLLAEEWRPSGNPVLLRVGTAAGRCAFLRGYPAMSAPAEQVGMAAARACCLDVYAAVARDFGQEGTAEAGCALLDGLQPAEAEAAYAAALERAETIHRPNHGTV
jgi:hypothetical protein